MKLNFKIDEDYLVIYTLQRGRLSSGKRRKDVKAFQNYARRKSKKHYNLLRGMLPPWDIEGGAIQKTLKSTPKFLNDLKKSRHFRKVLKQTEDYLDFCRDQWEKNYPTTEKVIKGLTGFTLNKKFCIYVTHPTLPNGKYGGLYNGCNVIEWGPKGKWPNYTTVYLWHEALHSYFGKSYVDHTIIELITDNELRSKLNNVKYPPFEGHEALLPLKRKILPHWRKYLKQDKKDVRKFTKKMNKMFGKVKVKQGLG